MNLKRIAYLTLGCDKNRVDTERSLFALHRAGFEIAPAPGPAFALVINTCGFIQAAKEESIEAIMEAVREKERGSYKVLAVVGCLAKRYRDELRSELPEVDVFMGLEHVNKLAAVLDKEWQRRAGGKEREKPKSGAPLMLCPEKSDRVLTTPGHYAFLKIAEGCDAACRFCAIPAIRGPLRSENPDRLVAEAKALEAAGAKELILVAQDTAAYGMDFDPRLELADLVENILAKTAIPWIRILYAHPEHVTDRLIELLATEKRLLGYLDLPIQHISGKMLRAMGRRMGKRETVALIDRILDRAPGVALRTTLLTGFPGETDQEFETLLDFIQEGRFTWASGFAFSSEEGTPAAKMEGRVDPELAWERLDVLMETQGYVTAQKLEAYQGHEIEVLVDGPYKPLVEAENREDKLESAADDDSPAKMFSARACFMAPEVDGEVILNGPARKGEFMRAKVTHSYDYDLEAVVE